MKKTVPIIIVAVLVIGGIAALVMNRSSNNTKMGSSSSHNSSSSSAQATNKVAISNFSFSPSSITVKKGTTVTWTNHDSAAHTVAETDGKTGPNSQDIATDQSYSFTYNSTGTFAYHCSIHPEMTGTVTVTP